MSTKLSQAPPLWRPKKSEIPKIPKALIVGADYFALTSRIDPQVKFWSVDQATKDPVATQHSIIPDGVTILWVSPHIEGDIRSKLLSQAIVRGLDIWREDMSSLQLREKLLPIWADERNRSMVYPSDQEFDDREAEMLEKEETGRERFLRERKAMMKEAAEQARLRQAEEAATVAVDMKQLEKLPTIERNVYLLYCELPGQNGERLAVVASKSGLPAANVQLILDRVQKKLAS